MISLSCFITCLTLWRNLNSMCYISVKLFLILCEYVLVCTCIHGLIKKLIFLVCVPSIAQLSTIMHSFALFIQHNVCFLFLVIKFFSNQKDFYVLYYFSWICNQGQPYYFYITCLCTLFGLDELIYYTLLVETLQCMLCGKMFMVFDYMILILKSYAFDCRT